MRVSKILFVDDDESFLRSLTRSFSRLFPGHPEIYSAKNAEDAEAIASAQEIDVAIIDLSLNSREGPGSGLRLLCSLLQHSPDIRVIVLTGHDCEKYGVDAITRGASTFLSKPPDIAHLVSLVRDAIDHAHLRQLYRSLLSSSSPLPLNIGLSSRNHAMRQALDLVCFAALNSNPVIILGETGTGKGLIAETIHRASLRLHQGRFVHYLPNFSSADLTASELFGHRKGAFTGAIIERKGLIEEAHQGTLFVDEVDQVPLQTQVSLLNVLQTKKFRPLGSNRELQSDFRLITASNSDVHQAVSEGRIRSDFYHRIAHFTINIPPLRERQEDIADLAEQFLLHSSAQNRLAVIGLSSNALGKLSSYNWPGNVRELLAVIESATALAAYRKQRLIEPEHIVFISPLSATSGKRKKAGTFRDLVRSFELELVEEALKQAEGNQTAAAQKLGLDRSTFRRILNRKHNPSPR